MEKLYGIEGVAARLGLARSTLERYIINRLITNGSFVENGIVKWSQRDFDKAEKEMAVFRELVVITTVALATGVDARFIRAWFKPDLVLGKKWYFHQDRIEEIKAKAEAIKTSEVKRTITTSNAVAVEHHRLRREKGYFSQSDVAELCGVQPISITYHIKKGHFAAPTHQLESYCGSYYTTSEVDKIVEFFKTNCAWSAAIRGPRKGKGRPKKITNNN